MGGFQGVVQLESDSGCGKWPSLCWCPFPGTYAYWWLVTSGIYTLQGPRGDFSFSKELGIPAGAVSILVVGRIRDNGGKDF